MQRACAAPRSRLARFARAWWWLMVLAPLVLSVPGCGGCAADDPVTAAKKKKEKEDEEKKKKSEKPKDPFESGPLVVEPGEGKAASNVVKPGHWVTASKAFKSNDGDVVGEFYSAAVDMAGRPLEVDHTPFRMVMTRSAPLPKGQVKHFEFLYYVPRRFEGQNATTRLQNKLYARGGGREIYHPGDEPTIRMPASQYHLLVLASDPDRYGYVKRLETINTQSDDLDDRPSVQNYRVSLPKLDKRVPVPRHPLAWTTIAFIFWDNVDPNLLSPEQQDGLLDWLHWGGQLIVSGPDSLDTLRGSFLEPHLPVEKVQSVKLEQPAFAEMNAFWSLADKKNNVRTLEVVAGKPPVGIEVKLHPDATWVPHTGELVAERRVGRGRIAVTSFPLTSRALVNWASLDNFFNNALLRRPNRKYSLPMGAFTADVDWVEKSLPNDPRLVTTLRYFSRDIGMSTGTNAIVERPAPDPFSKPTTVTVQSSVIHPDRTDWHYDGYGFDKDSGVAGWNDFCAAAEAARESLREAAGISIPKAGFVLRVIGIYLLVLVPVNWAIFRLLGRVEYAWVAAPIIAILGALAVVRVAQLDIGFARSQSEIAILELQGDHRRGHVTRYTALYSSLSTAYDVRFTDGSALAQPFPTKPREMTPSFNRPTPATVYLHRDKGMSLTGFMVRSNTTDFVHTEQMLSLKGPVRLVGGDAKGWSLENASEYPLRDAVVLRCLKRGVCEAAVVGDLDAERIRTLQWEPVDAKTLRPRAWADSPTMSRPVAGSTEVSLHRLVDLATKQLRLDPGDYRLLAWTATNLPGVEVEPQAPQVVSRTLILAHLREAPLPPVASDLNMRISVVDEEKKEDEEPPPFEPPPPDPLK
jgi:hypothetical protein